MSKVKFTKMHGLGNDYIYINAIEQEVLNPKALSRKLSNRNTGIGGDGLVLILPSSEADFRMRIFNTDGSEAEMCGNAIRCVAKYIYDRGLSPKGKLSIETLAGNKECRLFFNLSIISKIQVNMGIPRLENTAIPVLLDKNITILEDLHLEGQVFQMTCVSMGNPHCIIRVDKITDDHIFYWGPIIENHPLFPERTNVEFIEIVNKHEINMRVWERGSGETQACGTGASASTVAAIVNNWTKGTCLVHLLGGDLEIEWKNRKELYMTGPAEFVFDGEFSIS